MVAYGIVSTITWVI